MRLMTRASTQIMDTAFSASTTAWIALFNPHLGGAHAAVKFLCEGLTLARDNLTAFRDRFRRKEEDRLKRLYGRERRQVSVLHQSYTTSPKSLHIRPESW